MKHIKSLNLNTLTLQTEQNQSTIMTLKPFSKSGKILPKWQFSEGGSSWSGCKFASVWNTAAAGCTGLRLAKLCKYFVRTGGRWEHYLLSFLKPATLLGEPSKKQNFSTKQRGDNSASFFDPKNCSFGQKTLFWALFDPIGSKNTSF